jgi:hypothetical protein
MTRISTSPRRNAASVDRSTAVSRSVSRLGPITNFHATSPTAAVNISNPSRRERSRSTTLAAVNWTRPSPTRGSIAR